MLLRNKFDASGFLKRVGRPTVAEEIDRLVVLMANENPRWGYDRIVGALANLGHPLSDQTVGNILRRHGLSPAPKRKQTVSWKDSILSHRDVLVGMDFFTAEVLTRKGSSVVTQNRPMRVTSKPANEKARDIDSDGSPYRLLRYEQCLE